MLASADRVAHLLLLEGEEALAPRHQLEDDLLDLEAHLPLELPARERATLHEQLAELAVRLRRALRVARAREIRLRDLAAAQQKLAERMRIAPNGREHDGAAIEVHGALVVAQHGGDGERARLPAQVEQLEDVVDAELAKRSLDRHYATSFRRAEDRAAGRRRCATRAARGARSRRPARARSRAATSRSRRDSGGARRAAAP